MQYTLIAYICKSMSNTNTLKAKMKKLCGKDAAKVAKLNDLTKAYLARYTGNQSSPQFATVCAMEEFVRIAANQGEYLIAMVDEELEYLKKLATA